MLELFRKMKVSLVEISDLGMEAMKPACGNNNVLEAGL